MQNFQNYMPRGFFKKILENKIKSKTDLFNAIEEDDELDIRMRGNQLHVYYSGGKILEINPMSNKIDKKYTSGVTEKQERLEKALKQIDSSPEDYFKIAKEILDKWFESYPKEEREDQHNIASLNKSFSKNNNLIVIDIEFAASYNANYYNKNYMDNLKGGVPYKRYPNPRFDIIALDNEGQIYVLELKTGIGAIKNMEKHLKDFDNFIGNDKIGDNSKITEKRWVSFVNEMEGLLSMLQDSFGYSKSFCIDKNKKPIFMFAYTDKNTDNPKKDNERMKFKTTVKDSCVNTPIIWVDKTDYYLNKS